MRKVRSFAFVLLDTFAMMGVASAIEPLRAANRLAGRDIYRWSLLSPDGAPVRPSNGMTIAVDGPAARAADCDLVLVCAGIELEPASQTRITVALRQALRRGAAIGGISAGSFVLARAGLLDGYRCTIHWENRPAFLERFPQIDCTDRLYEIDRDRYTSAGGIAAMDMVLHLIARDLGLPLAEAVANQFLLERMREAGEGQRLVGASPAARDLPPAVRLAMELMTRNLEEPLAAAQIAAAIGTSTRQLERLFARHLGVSPARHYRHLRTERARDLLLHTTMPAVEVAVATGFSSGAHLAQAVRTAFGRPPSRLRRGAGG